MINITFSALTIYSIGLFFHGLLPIVMPDKQIACKIVNQIYVGGLLTYLFGFLIVWDYYTIKDGNWNMVIFSLIFWSVGIHLIKKNFFSN